jgi:hypothetical protein
MKRIRNLLSDDSGIGLVLALTASLIVFSLGAVWVATSSHELDQVTYNRHRTEAFNAAEAGARRAMAELQVDNDADGWSAPDGTALLATEGVRTQAKGRGSIWLGYDASAAAEACLPPVLTSGADELGEYVVRVERMDGPTEGLEYRIESWGWGPDRFSRQSVLRKVEIHVILKPLDTFGSALFAAKTMVGTNRKEIYGDVYAGESVTISNFTRIYPNDQGEIGIGRLEVFGDLLIESGSNVEFQGPLHIQGAIDDRAVGTNYSGGDLVNSPPVIASPGTFSTENDFRRADTTGTIRYGGTLAGGWDLDPVAAMVNATGLLDVPKMPLPTYTYASADYPTMGTTDWGIDVAGFETWFDANSSMLKGVHVIDVATGALSVDFKNTLFDDNFMLVVQDGDLTVKGFTKGITASADAPVTVAIVLDDTRVPGIVASVNDIAPALRYTLTMETGIDSIPDIVHHLVFAEGYFNVRNQATFYGTIYGNDDVSSNRLEVHFRPPDLAVTGGFNFVVPDSTRFIAQPILWRELDINEGTSLPTACSA